MERYQFSGDRPDLALGLSKRLGTPYTVTVERLPACRMVTVTSRCVSCKQTLDVSASEREIEDGSLSCERMAEILADVIETCRRPEFYEEGDCRCVDGLTPEQCLAKYEAWQRADYGCGRRDGWIEYKMPLQHAALTESQLVAAQQAWSAQLRTKLQQAEEKRRAEICVDDDRWEP